jgi:hypothetical protein
MLAMYRHKPDEAEAILLQVRAFLASHTPAQTLSSPSSEFREYKLWWIAL